jgi:glutamine synthetase
MFDDCLRTADRLHLSPDLRRRHEFNLIACFAAPFMGVSASGCHHNLAWRGGGEKEQARQRQAAGHGRQFPVSEGRREHLPPLGAKPSQAPSASIASAAPAWRADSHRLFHRQSLPPPRDTGWAPVYRLGLSEPHLRARISHRAAECRSVDSTVNPYLMAAAILRAFDDGINQKLDPGEPEERNIYAAMAAGKKVKKLPMSLGDALLELEKDETIKSAMPDEMYRVFNHYKRDEWEKFMSTVTDWDLKQYWDYLP